VMKCPEIELIAPAKIEKLMYDEARAYLVGKSAENDFTISSELVIIANGANSELAQKAGVQYQTQEVTQHALVSTIEVSQATPGVAYERFVNQDILALLPLPDNKYGVVWTAKNAEIDHLKSLPEKDFLKRLQDTFGYRVGRFKQIVSARQAYPLQSVIAQNEVKSRAIVLGNAAHTLHPAAGQGLNLALRRTAVLAEELVKARLNSYDLANPETLGRYIERTQSDVKNVAQFTSSLVSLFSHDAKLLSHLRGLGLFLFDRAIPLKTHFVEQAMGVANSHSLLSNGQALTHEILA